MVGLQRFELTTTKRARRHQVTSNRALIMPAERVLQAKNRRLSPWVGAGRAFRWQSSRQTQPPFAREDRRPGETRVDGASGLEDRFESRPMESSAKLHGADWKGEEEKGEEGALPAQIARATNTFAQVVGGGHRYM